MPRRHKQDLDAIRKKIDSLIPRLKSKSLAVRINAVKALGAFGKVSESIAEQLLPFTEDEDDTLRAHALQALVEIGRESPKIAKLVRATMLKSKDPAHRLRGYWILERIER